MLDISALTRAAAATGTLPGRSSGIGTGGGFLEKIASTLSAAEAQAAPAADTASGVRQASGTQAAGTQTVGTRAACLLEARLKQRYPGLVYHVGDASSRYWQGRNDYPFHLLYQEGTDMSQIENWKPSGPNPDPLDGQVQRNLGSIPPGSHAVVIHPKVQARMEEDPAYADVIYKRIEAWFTFDSVRNDAIIPGISAGSSQAIAIGEDGMIANVQSCSSGGFTRYGEKEEEEQQEGDDFWTARAKRHHLYMQQVVQAQILHSMGLSAEWRAIYAASLQSTRAESGLAGMGMNALAASQAAIAKTMALMSDPALREALGETVAGVSVDAVFAATAKSISDFHPGIL